jgi:hypothetical protein
MTSWTASPRLRGLIAEPPGSSVERTDNEAGIVREHCDLCAEPIPDTHRHLLDLTFRELRCACRACTVLFDKASAGGGRYRLVPDRRWYLPDFALDDAAWAGFGIPVDLAFFFHNSTASRVVALYPSPTGAVESLLDLAAWKCLERANPVLGELRPDVEALLINRTRGANDHWLAPIDDCFALVGLIRTHWKGLAGGSQAWDAISEYVTDLRARARPVPASGTGNGTGNGNAKPTT